MSQHQEDYLKIMYEFGDSQKLIANKYIAEKLKIAPASVTEMINKLAEEGLVEYVPYQGSRLSTKGRTIATNLYQSHELWEYFLVTHLDYQKEQAHVLAEELEHVSPQDLLRRLDSFLKKIENKE
ncbi:metal-dependent transcriptional regulator [Enterococcus nangangensis]|uniref:metal-dependent transcriptional regulator n=1 Tax=Enterococcus nangangensis TaxID=2559926 RepID=UPI0014858AD3|nr:metal-dependent transcriptional regulator [Enterococcus nangangensis]